MATRDLGPLSLLKRLIAARRGDVRAMEDVYHLRGVLTVIVVLSATIGLPGLMLVYYGIVGIRADELASAADVRHRADTAAEAFKGDLDAQFSTFKDRALTRLTSGQSVYTGQKELSDALRVVFRFDNDGNLAEPFLGGGGIDPREDQTFLLFDGWQEAQKAEQAGEWDRAATAYGNAARQTHNRRDKERCLYNRARALDRAGQTREAEAIWQQQIEEKTRDLYGFRLGDLARLQLAQTKFRRDPAGGQEDLQALTDSLLTAPWEIGRGGEAAVARRAIEELPSGDWKARAQGRVDERSSQLYWAERLQPELDTLGAKGRLLRADTGNFVYMRTDSALWAMTWTESEQYAFALDLRRLLDRYRAMAAADGGADDVVRATLLAPDAPVPPDTLARASLTPWLPGWSVVVGARDPAALAEQQASQRRRGFGIILLSLTMIVVGTVMSTRLVRRELDAARDKSDFAAHVSHELRSPLTQIRLKAEALQLGLATDDAARSRHYDIIVRESERLSRLIDNILDFSAIELGKKRYSFRIGDLGLTVARCVEQARVAMETKAMTIDFELPDDLPVIWHDADAVSQVVINLLSNAAKYGQQSGWIGVRVRVTGTEEPGGKKGGGEICVDVSDRGIGIAPAEQKQVFDQYYRSSDPQARSKKGTGIGLTIVRYIMEAHGGHVGIESAPGVGSTFTLHFPLSFTPPSANVLPASVVP